MKYIYVLFFSVLSLAAFAQAAKNSAPTIVFKEGALYSVRSSENLWIRMQSSQVEESMVDPSTRISNYYITERIEKVYPDGSADIAATLDSFTTKIYVGAMNESNEYFRFNSTNDFDIENRLKDIRALPRAQFLGHTLKYTIGNDGLIRSFANLKDFQSDAISRAFEYDITQAMLSLSDSLRVGQLLEQGFGAIAAAGKIPTGEMQLPYTVTEIHTTRSLKTKNLPGGVITFTGQFIDPPTKITYLEGMAWEMGLSNFKGGTFGSVAVKNGVVTSAEVVDSASMLISLDSERIKSAVHRKYSVTRTPLQVTQGTVTVREIKSHKAEYKEKDLPDDSDAIQIDVGTGKVVYPKVKQDSTKK